MTSPYLKCVVAAVLASLTAASGIWVDQPWLSVALAAVTAVGVYVTPNSPR